MTYIQMTFHVIFLFILLSMILDKIVLGLNFVLNYILTFPLLLITKKEKVADTFSSIISIMLSLISFYSLTLLLRFMVYMANTQNLNEIVYLIIGAVLFLYAAINQCRGIPDGTSSVIVDKYKTFCLYACIPLYLMFYFFNIVVFPEPVLWFIKMFYILFDMPIIGKIIAYAMFGTVLAILIHTLTMIISAYRIIKDKKKNIENEKM